MDAKLIADLFYETCLCRDITEDERRQTERTIQSLIDNGFDGKTIMASLRPCCSKRAVTKADLPDSLWEGSLIDRNKFYYHNVLTLIPESRFDAAKGEDMPERFYIENRIQFTMDDLVSYFIRRCGVDSYLVDRQKFKSQFKSMLEHGLRNSIAEPLDFLLAMIDNAARFNMEVSEPFEITNFINVDGSSVSNRSYTLRMLKRHATEQVARGYGKEIIR